MNKAEKAIAAYEAGSWKKAMVLAQIAIAQELQHANAGRAGAVVEEMQGRIDRLEVTVKGLEARMAVNDEETEELVVVQSPPGW